MYEFAYDPNTGHPVACDSCGAHMYLDGQDYFKCPTWFCPCEDDYREDFRHEEPEEVAA